jgi:hypothetical protein
MLNGNKNIVKIIKTGANGNQMFTEKKALGKDLNIYN